MRWLDRNINSVDMNLSKLQEIVKDEKSDMLQPMVSQRVGHDLETEQQEHIYGGSFHRWVSHYFSYHLYKYNHVTAINPEY